jgi:catechol-2,3-dioxygenase
MLSHKDAVANLAVKDLQAARKVYEGILGLKPIDAEGDEVIVYQSGKSTLNVYRSKQAGTNKATAVGDIHIAGDMKVAWFKDPDGNILNIING